MPTKKMIKATRSRPQVEKVVVVNGELVPVADKPRKEIMCVQLTKSMTVAEMMAEAEAHGLRFASVSDVLGCDESVADELLKQLVVEPKKLPK